ncbi:MAG: thiolase domain-containing protein [Dehalococcoidales bacterium]|nr:thiolase domain-containing protein [Dehalococcoidales bacterium]
MEDVAIIGVGQTNFSRSCGVSIRELCFDAYKEAMEGLDITNQDIDASITCSAPEYDKQRTPSGLISEYLELTPKPAFYVETVCSSSTTGLRIAWSLIKSGLHKVVAVIGFQKMSELTSREAAERMGRGADIIWEAPFGITMPAGYALYAQAHMTKYGTTEEQLAKIRVKNASYGAKNAKATYRKELSLNDVLTSDIVSNPLKRFDCCANADGASCIIVASEDVARKVTKIPIWIIGLGAATATMTMSGRKLLTGLTCSQEAAKQAYQMAGVGPEDIDVAEVHDCFTIAELLAYEDLGFAKPGEGVRLIEEKETYHDGKIPVNVDGGLLSKGHPIGATGGSQVRTVVRQLRGEATEAQVKDAEVGLVHNIGGVGQYGNVVILRR